MRRCCCLRSACHRVRSKPPPSATTAACAWIRRTFADDIGRMSRAIDRAFPEGARLSQPAGVFVLWVDLPRPFKVRALFQTALGRGICVAPGEVFSVAKHYSNCMKLSCGHPSDARIERVAVTLGEFANATISRKSLNVGTERNLEAENLLFRQIWYNRHWNLRGSIDRGKHKLVTKEEWDQAAPDRRSRAPAEDDGRHKSGLKRLRQPGRLRKRSAWKTWALGTTSSGVC
jgi:hypothetical protein